jgi:hypothetical protein
VSSTGHKLLVEVHAYLDSASSANDEVDVTLTQNKGAGTEDHSWMFPIHATDLDADSLGQGTLELSSKEISPFGALRLTMTPIAKATTQKCDGAVAALVTPVKLADAGRRGHRSHEGTEACSRGQRRAVIGDRRIAFGCRQGRDHERCCDDLRHDGRRFADRVVRDRR